MMKLLLIPALDAEPEIHSVGMLLSKKEGYLRLIMPSERGLSTKRWSDVNEYLTEALPTMRKELKGMLNNVSAAYSLIGRDIGTLYATYYALLEKQTKVKAIVHSDKLGGDSHFAERNRALIKRLGSMVLSQAQTYVNLLDAEAADNQLPRYYRYIPLIDGVSISFNKSAL